MKATGIVRRFDELGRIRIPREVRRTLKITDGQPMELFMDGDSIVLRKYEDAEMRKEKEIRANAIDEFAERLKRESFSGYATLEDYSEDAFESVAVEDICRIAEEMKGGAE